MAFTVLGFGLRASSLGFRAWGLGFRVGACKRFVSILESGVKGKGFAYVY